MLKVGESILDWVMQVTASEKLTKNNKRIIGK